MCSRARNLAGRSYFTVRPDWLSLIGTDKRGFIAAVSPCSRICGGSPTYIIGTLAGRSLATPRHPLAPEIYRVAHARHLDLWLSTKRFTPDAPPSPFLYRQSLWSRWFCREGCCCTIERRGREYARGGRKEKEKNNSSKDYTGHTVGRKSIRTASFSARTFKGWVLWFLTGVPRAFCKRSVKLWKLIFFFFIIIMTLHN